MGVSHTMVSRLGTVFEVVAVVIRQYVCLEELHVADVFGCKKEVIMWGWPFLFLYYDSYRWYNTRYPASLVYFNPIGYLLPNTGVFYKLRPYYHILHFT